MVERRNVLVTSAGAKVPLIRALHDVLQQKAEVHAGDGVADVPARYVADRFWHMPNLRQLLFDDVVAYCDTHRIGLVVPTRDAELLQWSRWSAALHCKGVSLVLSQTETLITCLDKKRFVERLTDAGEPVIPIVALERTTRAKSRFVVKERFGAGSSRIGLDLDAIAAHVHARTLATPIVQPYIDGQEYSIDLYVARSGEVLGVIPRRRVHVAHGEAQITETVRDCELETLGERIAQLLDVRGPATVQVMVNDDGPHVIECNPRFGGASTLGIAAGLRVFEWMYLEARGESCDGLPFVRSPNELRQVRTVTDQIVSL